MPISIVCTSSRAWARFVLLQLLGVIALMLKVDNACLKIRTLSQWLVSLPDLLRWSYKLFLQ